MTDSSVLSASEAVKFLEWLDPVGLHNLVAIDPVTKAVEASNWVLCEGNADLVAWINARNGRMNLYFSINEPSRTARLDTKLRRDEIGAIRAFHVDIDNLEGEPDWDMDCLPSAIIDSGGGRWGFWKLAEPYLLDESDSVAAIEAQNRALTSRFHGDGQAHNIDRIARLPGTLNIPNEAKRKKGRVETVSRILSLTGMTYEPAEVAAWCPPLAVSAAEAMVKADQAPLADLDAPASVARATRYLLLDAPEAVEGSGGDETTYRVAARLKDFGVSREVAFDLLLDSWNETKAVPPWPAAELRDKVRNAYNHGTAAPGRNAANLAETEFEAVDTVEPPKRRIAATLARDLQMDISKKQIYLIDGLIDLNTMHVTYGRSNVGKSHVVLDMSLAIATGRQWGGRLTRKGLVVYVAAEAADGLQRRYMAHTKERPEVDWDAVPFALVKYPLNMRGGADTKALIAEIKRLEAETGERCLMVVIDTLARTMGGGDENSATDMGVFVTQCGVLQAATSATIHLVHHTGKDQGKGMRGSTALVGAIDTDMAVVEGQIVPGKQRENEKPLSLAFEIKGVSLGLDADGREVKSAIAEVHAPTEFNTEDAELLEVYEAVRGEITQKMQNDAAGGKGKKRHQVTRKEMLAVMTKKMAPATFDRRVIKLVEKKLLVKPLEGLFELP